ncbi:hypothetical protein CWI01_00030, partial [Streptococcus pneumoniae]
CQQDEDAVQLASGLAAAGGLHDEVGTDQAGQDDQSADDQEPAVTRRVPVDLRLPAQRVAQRLLHLLLLVGEHADQLDGGLHVADPVALARHQLDHRRDRHAQEAQGGEEDLFHGSYPTRVGVAVKTWSCTGAPGIVTDPGTSGT